METKKHVIYCVTCSIILLIIESMVLVRLIWFIDWTTEQGLFLMALGVVQVCMHYFGKSKQFPSKYVTFMKNCTTIIASLFFILIVMFSYFILQPVKGIDLYAVVSSIIIQVAGYIVFVTRTVRES